MKPIAGVAPMLPHCARASLVLAMLVASIFGLACDKGCESPAGETGHLETHGHADEFERGPNGGRIFESGNVTVELWIAEEGIPPEFRARLMDGEGRTLPPDDVRLWVILHRLGGRRDSLGLGPQGDLLRSVGEVSEPHSYRANVVLERHGKRHAWEFEQEEGRVELAAEAVAAGGMVVAPAGPARIQVRVEAPGEVRLNAERVVQVRPRFPGIVTRLEGRLGDCVDEGNLLAVIHGDESLADYEIRASIPGTIVQRAAAPGEAVDRETVLYTIADLSTVWVDLALYPQNVSKVRLGQEVIIRAGAGDDLSATGRIRYVGPLLEQDTRISYARIVLPNDNQRWKPGLFVSGEIVVERAGVAVAVPDAAIVRMGQGQAVFRADGTIFELQPVRTGRTDGVSVEILEGLAAGDPIVVENAFLLKAELGKSEASHDH